MEERYGYLAHTQVTFATHVHLGVISGDEAITLMRSLKPYLPLLEELERETARRESE
jgi:glutamate---cysteine ligase / carboxylate-amine ligase